MLDSLRVVNLVDNCVRRQGLLAEHGLAYWIEADGFKLLWDTGQGRVLPENARALGVDLSTADAVALSHGHYDHTGGVSLFTQGQSGHAAPPRVYLHREALRRRFARGARRPHREIGVDAETRRWLQKPDSPVTWVEGPMAIVDDVWLTGAIPRNEPLEDTGGPFYLDEDCTEPDLLPDDQALFFQTPHGTVVLLGCAHAGTVNTLRAIQRSTEGAPVRALLGGMHLHGASQERLRETVAALEELDIELLVPGHCTGFAPTALLKDRFGDRCRPGEVGQQWVWP
jgi:7,8-dihydropterin-6-yl-methyl-4-(beta-D-ribofuranosyl)aminobenzene 5'-phosphate synthase